MPVGAFDKQQTLRALHRLKEEGFRVRGHCLVWPNWKKFPIFLRPLKENPVGLPALINAHIVEELVRTGSCIDEWDVLNEPRGNTPLIEELGYETVADWFKTAREFGQGQRMVLNEYDVLVGWGRTRITERALRDTISKIREAGGPIDGIGFQAHVGTLKTPPEEVIDRLDRLSDLGLPVSITEFDIRFANDRIRAAYTRDFMIAAFSHPLVQSFQVWGFWAGDMHYAKSALFNEDWTIRPNGDVWRDLIYSKWWTDLNGETDFSGYYSARAFYGTHQVKVSVGGLVKEKEFQLIPGNSVLNIEVVMD